MKICTKGSGDKEIWQHQSRDKPALIINEKDIASRRAERLVV